MSDAIFIESFVEKVYVESLDTGKVAVVTTPVDVTVDASGSAVQSVNGETGDVVLTAADVGALASGSGYNTPDGWLKLDGSGLVPDNRIGSSIARDTEVAAAIGALGLGDAATKDVGASAGTVAAGDDPRFSDARTPTAHAASHGSAGSDPVTVAQSQVTNLPSDLAARLSTTGGGKDAVSNLGSLTGTVAIDLANGNSFYGTLTGTTTFTMTGFTNGAECEFVLGVVQDSTPRSIVWPAAVKWPGGVAPTISTASGARDVFVFRSRDGGTTIDGWLAGKGMA